MLIDPATGNLVRIIDGYAITIGQTGAAGAQDLQQLARLDSTQLWYRSAKRPSVMEGRFVF